MKIYQNDSRCSLWHIVDRLPETQGDLDYLKKLFPLTIVFRKSNDKCTLLECVKIRNIHWYK